MIFENIDLTNDSLYTYFINNQRTMDHQSVIFGLRELNSTEMDQFCSNLSSILNLPILDQPFNFTANYELRTYTSGCYYLDNNNNWQSDGLLVSEFFVFSSSLKISFDQVGPLTNHYQTQCYSTHLTTFAGGFLVLPAPINWNYVFANADFNQNKTIYLTVICVSIIYILLMIYARYKDKKDIEKVR
jgi:polycystin 1L2